MNIPEEIMRSAPGFKIEVLNLLDNYISTEFDRPTKWPKVSSYILLRRVVINVPNIFNRENELTLPRERVEL